MLRVWHVPQVPGPAFYVAVETPAEGLKILDVLADYDLFQFNNRIKPDYANAAGLEELVEGEWLGLDEDELRGDG